MRRHALTTAIAGALALPMAAGAVDVTLSGHVNRALFITDSDDSMSTSGKIKDNGSSGTRIRVKGTGEMMDGASAGVLLEYGATDTLKIRYADVWFGGGFGKVSIGHGDQGGEGSSYKGHAAVLGTGHGQDTNGVASNYYTSLDGGGGRNERIRYDTPAVGPFSAAISAGTGDQISAGVSVSQSFGGASFNAGVGTIRHPGGMSTISGSAGVSLASGLAISGAWGTGTDHMGMMTEGMEAVPGTPAMGPMYRPVWTSGAGADNIFGTTDDTRVWRVEGTKDGEDIVVFVEAAPDADGSGITLADTTVNVETGEALGTGTYTTTSTAAAGTNPIVNFDKQAEMYQMQIKAANEDGASAEVRAQGEIAESNLKMLFDTFKCAQPKPAEMVRGDAKEMIEECGMRVYEASTPEMDGSPAVMPMMTYTDPSFFQVAVSYAFGDTKVGVSWYQSSDKYRMGSELTAIGFGVDHNLPKIGTNVYAAAQNYSVNDGDMDSDNTVVMIGARVKF